MKFKARGKLKSKPKFDLQAKLDPIDVDLGLEGALSATLGTVSGSVSEIPVRVRIPFLIGERVVASVGGFDLSLRPVNLLVERARLRVGGRLGCDGVQGRLKGGMSCKSRMEASGNLVGKAGTVALDFTEDESEDDA